MDEETRNSTTLPYASAIIRLLRGTVFDEDTSTWSELVNYRSQIHEFFKGIGLRLHLDESEGFGFLTQPYEEDETIRLPRLVKRKHLTYELTLLLVILRERLEEFDDKTLDASKCFISRQEILENMELLVGEKNDQVKLITKIDTNIGKAVDFGFLKKISNPEDGQENPTFEIRRVIKAKIGNDTLEAIKKKMEEHIGSL